MVGERRALYTLLPASWQYIVCLFIRSGLSTTSGEVDDDEEKDLSMRLSMTAPQR